MERRTYWKYVPPSSPTDYGPHKSGESLSIRRMSDPNFAALYMQMGKLNNPLLNKSSLSVTDLVHLEHELHTVFDSNYFVKRA